MCWIFYPFSQLILYTGSLHLWSLTLSSKVKLQGAGDQCIEKFACIWFTRREVWMDFQDFWTNFTYFCKNQEFKMQVVKFKVRYYIVEGKWHGKQDLVLPQKCCQKISDSCIDLTRREVLHNFNT